MMKNLNNYKVRITKAAVCILLPFTLLLSSNVSAQNCGHEQTSIDPELHVGLSAIAGYLGESYIHSKYQTAGQKILVGTAIGLIPGTLKELVDYSDTESYCGEDMLLNLGGALAGSLLAYNINKKYRVTFNKQSDNYMVGVSFKD